MDEQSAAPPAPRPQLDRERLRRHLQKIGAAIHDRVPVGLRWLMKARGVDLQLSIRTICDEIADLPDDDLDRILKVFRWEANAVLVPDPPKVAYLIDRAHHESLSRVLDILTRLA